MQRHFHFLGSDPKKFIYFFQVFIKIGISRFFLSLPLVVPTFCGPCTRLETDWYKKHRWTTDVGYMYIRMENIEVYKTNVYYQNKHLKVWIQYNVKLCSVYSVCSVCYTILELPFGIPECFTMLGYCTMLCNSWIYRLSRNNLWMTWRDIVSSRDPQDLKIYR